jgi:hypothetical protein
MLPTPEDWCLAPTSFKHTERLIAQGRAAAGTALQRSSWARTVAYAGPVTAGRREPASGIDRRIASPRPAA